MDGRRRKSLSILSSGTNIYGGQLEALVGEYLRTRDIGTEHDIITGTFWIVLSVVSGYVRKAKADDADDIVEQGLLGLIYAVENFNPARGAPFEAYARTCIRGFILKFVQDNRLIRIPKDRQAEARKLRRLMENEDIGVFRAAERLGMTPEKAVELLDPVMDPDGPDVYSEDEEEREPVAATVPSAEDEWFETEMRRFIMTAVKNVLSERDADIVLSEWAGVPRKQLAEKYNLSEQRIWQIISKSALTLGKIAEKAGYT